MIVTVLFGQNKKDQLGTGTTTVTVKIPQKLLNVPPVVSVSCGYEHTLIITNDSDLWSWGANESRQLCLGYEKVSFKPQKTLFSNILKISAGFSHSLFQNNKGEIFSCGNNYQGQCGLGHFDSPQIAPSLILNLPSNIVQFVCGSYHNLFLDSEGNVFSVGDNFYGQLGLGYNRNQNESNEYGQLGFGHNFHSTDKNELNKIPNIPPIKIISCVGSSSYLIDFEGNLWTFGKNNSGQLGHGDNTSINTPKIINTLKDIQQISNGCSADHFFAKNSQNHIFATGDNVCGKLGTGDDTSPVSIPKEINSKYFSIWGSNQHITKQRKGMCLETTTIINWQEKEMEMIELIRSKIKQVKLNLSCDKIKQEFPPKSFESWNEVHDYLKEKSKQIDSKLNEKQHFDLQHEKDIQTYETELKDIEHQLQQLQSRKKEIEENLLPKAKQSQFSFGVSCKKIENNQEILAEMCSDVSTFCKNENEMNEELCELFKQKKFEEFDCSEISKCLWKMDLTKYQSLFELNQINGSVVYAVGDTCLWKQLGLEIQDFVCFSYHIKMMKAPGYLKIFSPDYEHDCFVCSHNTPEKTIHLLKEYEIPIEDDFILKNNYTAPMLISKVFLEDLLGKDSFSQKGIQIMLKLEKWKLIHESHLQDLFK